MSSLMTPVVCSTPAESGLCCLGSVQVPQCSKLGWQEVGDNYATCKTLKCAFLAFCLSAWFLLVSSVRPGVLKIT